ncbi:MAG: hypothetical protein RLZZ164_690 [Actinomycetota bacterium]
MANPTPIHKARSAKMLTIGQVLDVLIPEFPGLSQSKLRFLEENGLITPQRTDAGYRIFEESDVQRLRLILDWQQTRFLPLKVIAQLLEDLDAGRSPQLPGEAGKPKAGRIAKTKKVSRIELISETGITDALIAESQEVGLLTAEPFDVSALEIARSVVRLKDGFGLTPRHLRGIKTSAERSIGIIEGVVAPVLAKKEAASPSRAAHYAHEMQDHFANIHEALVRTAIVKLES